jgi:hypothetical protein
MSRLFRLLNLRPKEGIKAFLLLVMLFVFITGFPFAATLLMMAMMSWAMSRVITARAESGPVLVNITKPGKTRGSFLRNIREGFQSISSFNDLSRFAPFTFPYGRSLPGSAPCSPGHRGMMGETTIRP